MYGSMKSQEKLEVLGPLILQKLIGTCLGDELPR